MLGIVVEADGRSATGDLRRLVERGIGNDQAIAAGLVAIGRTEFISLFIS